MTAARPATTPTAWRLHVPTCSWSTMHLAAFNSPVSVGGQVFQGGQQDRKLIELKRRQKADPCKLPR